MILRTVRILVVLCAGLAAAGWTQGAPVQDPDTEGLYGPLPVFEFHSGFWVNLHHFLYHEAREKMTAGRATGAAGKNAGPTLKVSAEGVALTAEEQKAWDAAVAFYVANEANKDIQINVDLMLLKNQLSDFEDCDELLGKKKSFCDAGLPGAIGQVLESAAPIYRAHWWKDQDRANRRWVARVAPLVREQGVGLSQKLAEIYQSKWPKERIRVEVCGYANAGGAYTTLDPLRVTISSLDPRNQGVQALEVLFHEASHGIALPVQVAIQRECRQRDKPIPRNLWHALIYYTTSEVLKPVMEEETPKDGKSGGAGGQEPGKSGGKVRSTPVPRVLSDELNQRGWDEYLRLITMYWQPYLDGKVNFEDAIAHMVSAL